MMYHLPMYRCISTSAARLAGALSVIVGATTHPVRAASRQRVEKLHCDLIHFIPLFSSFPRRAGIHSPAFSAVDGWISRFRGNDIVK